MLRGNQLTIGAFNFDLVGKDAHKVTDIDLGPTGELHFTTSDWGRGILPAEAGVNHVDGYYASARGVDASFPKQLILQPAANTVSVAGGASLLAAPLKQVDIGTTSVLATSGRYLYNINGSGQWVQSFDTGSGPVIKDLAVFGGQVAAAYTGAFAVSTTAVASSWTVSSTAADRWGVLNTQVYAGVRPNTVYSSLSFTGTRDSGTTVSDSGFNINSLVGLEQVLMIGKEDGVYSIDADGTVVPFTPELRSQANSNFASVKASSVFNGDYYMRTLNGLVQISGADGQKRRVGLDQLATPDLPTPVVAATAADDRYLYALCATSSTDLTIARRKIDGSWHIYYTDATSGAKIPQHLAVSGVLGYPALFFSYLDSTSNYVTKYIRLSTFPNPLQDTNYRYSTQSQDHWVRLGRFGSAEAPAIIDRATIQSRNLGASVNITLYYAVDGGSIGTFGPTATTSPLATIPATTPITGHLFDFYAYMGTTAAATTPVITGLSFKGQWRSERRRLHTYFVKADVYGDTKGGGKLRESPVTTIGNLEALRQTNLYVSVKDENDQTFSGFVQSYGRVSGDTTRDDKEPGHTIQVNIIESVPSVAAAAYGYDQAVYS